MSRFVGEPPVDQSCGERSRPLSLREQVASALGINREPAYLLTDSEILSAIRELRAERDAAVATLGDNEEWTT